MRRFGMSTNQQHALQTNILIKILRTETACLCLNIPNTCLKRPRCTSITVEPSASLSNFRRKCDLFRIFLLCFRIINCDAAIKYCDEFGYYFAIQKTVDFPTARAKRLFGRNPIFNSKIAGLPPNFSLVQVFAN